MTRELNLPENKAAFREDENQVVIGRVPRGYWWLAGGVFALGVVCGVGLYFSSPKSALFSVKLIILAMASFPCGLGIIGGWSLARTRVIADETGLRWRGMGAWKRATWMQVRDYYTRTLPKSGKSYIVETEVGKLDLKDLTHGALLRQMVEHHARWAQAKTWEERGRAHETLELTAPETFETDQSTARFFWVMLAVVLFGLPFLMTLQAGPGLSGPMTAYRSFTQTWQTLGPLWALGILGMIWFPGLIYGLMLFALWPVMRAAQKRKEQSITISPYGLTWRDATTGREVNARWEEVRDFYIDELPGWVRTAARGVVETARGDFDFVVLNNSGKRNGGRLRALIQKYCASRGLKQQWEARDKRRKTTSTNPPDATQIFTYRDSPLRVMLPFSTFLAAMMCFTAVARYIGLISVPNQAPYNPGDLAVGLFFGGPLTAASIWMWRQYFYFQIRTDDHGLMQQCGRKRRFIAWPDVREYEAVAGWGIIRSDSETIRFYSALGGVSELQKIIQQRATRSLTHSW